MTSFPRHPKSLDICSGSTQRRFNRHLSYTEDRRRISLRASRNQTAGVVIPRDLGELTPDTLLALRHRLCNLEDKTAVETLYDIAVHCPREDLVPIFLREGVVSALWGLNYYGLRVVQALCERDCEAMAGILLEHLPSLCDLAMTRPPGITQSMSMRILITCAENDVLVDNILTCIHVESLITTMYRGPDLECVVLVARSCRFRPRVTERALYLEFGTCLMRTLLSFPEDRLLLFSCLLDVLNSIETGDSKALSQLCVTLPILLRCIATTTPTVTDPLETFGSLTVLAAMARVDSAMLARSRLGIVEVLEGLYFSAAADEEMLQECGALIDILKDIR